MSYVLLTVALLTFAMALGLSLVSRREHELTAARRAFIAALVLPLPFVIVALVPGFQHPLLYWVLLGPMALGLLIYLIPINAPKKYQDDLPTARLDERTVMFSRKELIPGTERFESYYKMWPEHRQADDRFRLRAGLMSDKASRYEPLSFAAAEASFVTVGELASLIDGPVADVQQTVAPQVATDFIKGWAQKLGAVDCGVTELQTYHLYTHKGRGDSWGQPISQRHRYAIAFTVEMDHRNLGAAPEGPTLMESAQQYLSAGAVATQLAVCLRELGWSATAHIDGNYEVICPLVAKDAGLGELGRMGLLMTPKLGPRVRLGVVTTDLPLVLDKRTFDPAILHFCSLCKKCADICPAAAIPTEGQSEIDGVQRWQIDSEACFTYWCQSGTDCGQCMKVCPYSHPDSLMHNLVRFGLKRSAIFRQVALWMDDLLYGRRPQTMPLVKWLPRRTRNSHSAENQIKN